MSFFHSKPQRFLAFVVLLVLVPRQSPAEEVDFERDIVPILEEHCWHCHGEDEQESDLRLDLRVKMLKGGNSGLSAVVPGKPEKSYLIEVINHVDEDMAMPPDEDKIPAEEIELLTRWIKEGANWPGQMDALDDEGFDHWSFQPVVRPEVPIVAFRSANDAPDGTQLSPRLRRSSPVDAFLLDRLAHEDLSFSAPADPRSLIRRASIVLTGIAPTPKETADFQAAYEKDAEQAYTALVDRLLHSPHFGERLRSTGSTSFAGRKPTGPKRTFIARTPGSIAITSCVLLTKTNRTTNSCKNKSRAIRWALAKRPGFLSPVHTCLPPPSAANRQRFDRRGPIEWTKSCRPSVLR